MIDNIIKIWNDALYYLSSKVSSVSYDVWLKSLEPVSMVDNKLILLSSSVSIKNTVTKNYSEIIIEALKNVSDFISGFDIITKNEKPQFIKDDIEIEEILSYNFDNKFTFDSFVVGGSNQIAYAAAKSVAENPGVQHNPLFIYGGVGLGKTHIIHAIGNHILSNNKKTKILYVTTEQFINEFIDSIRNSKDNELNKKFREKYRNVDVLMLDDIQFLAGKTSTQEALFHTFNDLYQNKKQIIITSDKHPKELTFLEERLQSRFQCGLTVDISAPDIETRIAILQKKAYEKKVIISYDVINFIAEKFENNIRQLEGALSKVLFYFNLLNLPCNDITLVKEALKDDIDTTQAHILTIDSIVNSVCSYYGISKDDIVGKKKTKQIVEPRQIAMYLISDMLSMPLVNIGDYFGGRDHTTIIHARDKVSNNLKTDLKLYRDIQNIKDMIDKK
ncbi:MAG: chromosomal replication initiator protein DnaA [Clostridia bacterium]